MNVGYDAISLHGNRHSWRYSFSLKIELIDDIWFVIVCDNNFTIFQHGPWNCSNISIRRPKSSQIFTNFGKFFLSVSLQLVRLWICVHGHHLLMYNLSPNLLHYHFHSSDHCQFYLASCHSLAKFKHFHALFKHFHAVFKHLMLYFVTSVVVSYGFVKIVDGILSFLK